MKAWFNILPSYKSFHFKDTITSLEDEQSVKDNKDDEEVMINDQ